ncbi:UDP-3-O-acyl-N-acetylglucosamine deacetylase [soil metagenome]
MSNMTISSAKDPLKGNLRQLLDSSPKLVTYRGKGMTSKQEVLVEVYQAPPGSGITFLCVNFEKELVAIPANASSVVNTLRNVVLGSGKTRLCIVEHFMCAVTLWGLDDLYVLVDGPEMPLADGSAQFWIELFKNAGIEQKSVVGDIELPEVVSVNKGDRSILAVPADSFSVTYLMDWKHPKIGQVWKSWEPSQDPKIVYEARTFGMLKEHEMLGLVDDVVSITEDDFTMPLRSPDEPVRHKLLDLIGDLALVGVNPLRIKARFISTKGGHELDVDIAKKLLAVLNLSN